MDLFATSKDGNMAWLHKPMDLEIVRSLMQVAYTLAGHSLDPSTQCGAVLCDDNGTILADGINEFPRGVEYNAERWERPLKYQVIEHAERNAIFDAAARGVRTQGLTMIAPWAACADCARAIIQAGITKLIRHQDASDRSPANWVESIAIADTMLKEAGVAVENVVGKIFPDDSAFGVRHTGVTWNP